eukprot:2364241-Rhodomonas_salina.7
MYICYGRNHVRIPMYRQEFYLPETLYDKAMPFLHDGTTVYFEYDYCRYVPVYNEHELTLACRVTCESHNENHAQFDEDGWIQDVANIWERAEHCPDDDEESEEREDEEDPEYFTCSEEEGATEEEPTENDLLAMEAARLPYTRLFRLAEEELRLQAAGHPPPASASCDSARTTALPVARYSSFAKKRAA